MHDKLKSNEIFLDKILTYADLRVFKGGEEIVTPESNANAFYYVVSGTVEVSYIDQYDTRITVALIGEAEFFGEIGFFDGASRVRNIRAAGDSKVGIFDRATMQQIQENDQGLYIDFLHLVTGNICSKFRRIVGEREPISGYAESLTGRRSAQYAESKPIPSSLVHSSHWHQISSSVEALKSELFDLSHTLQKKHSEGKKDEQSETRCRQVLMELNESLDGFESVMSRSGYQDVMWGYVFKEFFPYLMRSHFAERAYFKPKGYAGDFLMMEHIYANESKGDGKLGEIIDDFCLQRPGALAIRSRRKFLKNQLMELTQNMEERPLIRIMNLACGPNRELFDFLGDCQYTERIEALCVDIDSEALQYTNQHVNIFPHRASVRLMSENVIKWSLGRVQHHIEKQDIIYSAGLCDYLDERLFRALICQCYEHLKPGGKLLLGNFTSYPDSLFLDKLLRWQLIYRDADELRELFAPTPFGDNVVILSEKENVNLFALATKE